MQFDTGPAKAYDHKVIFLTLQPRSDIFFSSIDKNLAWCPFHNFFSSIAKLNVLQILNSK